MAVYACHGADNQIAALGSRIVHVHLQACFDAGAYDKDAGSGIFFHGFLHGSGHRRHDGRENPALDLRGQDFVKLQGFLENSGILQAGRFLLCGKALVKEKPGFSRALLFKAAYDNICVSDIYRENHVPFLRR